LAEGRRLTHKEYDNVVETIPLAARGINQDQAIQTLRELLQMTRQAGDYWTEPYEYDHVWLEVRPACDDCFIGYSQIVKASVPQLTNPFGQPFFSASNQAVMEDITLIIEREPFWRAIPPGSIIGPLYNLIDNPDFELWNFGIADSQPDSWNDIDTLSIVGTNNRQETAPHSGQYALRIDVTGSSAVNAAKGLTQVIDDIQDETEYTVIAWVRNDGIISGVGRILITYSSQLELYRSADLHGWTLYTGKITTGIDDVVAITCEILTTATSPQTLGTMYVDSLMFLEGDFEQLAIDNILPYVSGGHIVNHWDQPDGTLITEGDINWVDVWNVPGDVSAPIRVELQNNNTPADVTNPVEVYSNVRIGMRRARDVVLFDNYFDPTGIVDATASSDDRVDITAVNNSFREVTAKIISNQINTDQNQGRFRVFARLYDEDANATLQARLRYFIGTAGVSDKILNASQVSVGSNWTIVDLTPNASMNFDLKFSGISLNQIGYIMELARTSGSSGARIDYILTMPTDGGFIKATLDPPVSEGNVFIVDDTFGLSVAGARKKEIWQRSFASGDDTEVFDFAEFLGRVFICTSVSASNDGRVYRQQTNGTWLEVLRTTGGEFHALEVYNGQLYGIGNLTSGGLAQLWSTSDGLNWTAVGTVTASANVNDLKSFDGELWMTGDTAGNLYSYDGTAISNRFTPVPADTLNYFAVYRNQLWFNTRTLEGHVYYYDPVDGTFNFSFDPVEDKLGRMTAWQNYLFLGTRESAAGNIYRFDGENWETVSDSEFAYLDDFWIMQVYEDQLYAGGDDTASLTTIRLIRTDNPAGTLTWVTAPRIPQIRTILSSFASSNGVLHLGSGNPADQGEAEVWIFAEKELQFKVADYSGRTFRSPSRRKDDEKRHRFFFSYDRENSINGIDDKGLVGIGFVPRYLALRGRD
jgi:hypothetical protein